MNRAESSEFSGSLFLSPFSSFRLHFPANGKQVTAVSEMAFDSLKQPEISTSRLSRLSFHFQEPERSTVETGRLVFADAGSVQLGDDDRRGDIRCARGSLTPSSSCKEIRGNSSARDGHDMDIAGFCHMIFVENLEKGILPLTITDFIFQQLRISCQAFVLPSNPSEAYTRGITMVNNKRNLHLLSDFLESSDHVVTPSSGRPWVVTGRLRVSFKTCKLTTQTTFMTEPKQQYGLCISNVERRIVCGTTIVAFILENFIFIGTDTRATDYSGSVTRTNVNKLRLLTEHIVGAMAGDGAACLGLWVHLRWLIRDYNENETRNRLGSKRSSDRLGVKVVARWALDYLKRKNEHDTEIVIAGYESTGRASIFLIDVNDQYPQSYTSVVIGSGAPAAKLIFDPQIYMRQSLSVESAKLLSLDALIAGAVEDSDTGDSLYVYQMVPAGGYEIQLTRDVLGGYTERYNHLNLKPENEGRVLFVLLESEEPVKDLLHFFRLRRVSRCINLGPTLHNSIVYRVVFKDRFGAKKAYEDCCFQYEGDTISNTRRGNPNPYHPFTVDLTLLEIPVRSVYVPSQDKTALVSQITSGEHVRILREVPFQHWPLSEEQQA